MSLDIDFRSLFASGAFSRQQYEILHRLATGVFDSSVSSSTAVWGAITGTLSLQVDLQAALDALTAAISAEATTRSSADTALAGLITAETTARANADTTLSGLISAETAARISADSAEATARAAADTTLATAITAEASTRAAADSAETAARIAGDAATLSSANAYTDTKTRWAQAGGTADALTAAYTPAVASLPDATLLFLRALLANATTTPTLTVDGIGPYTIKKNGAQPLAAADIAGVGHDLILRVRDNFSSVWFELMNPATASQSFPAVMARISLGF